MSLDSMRPEGLTWLQENYILGNRVLHKTANRIGFDKPYCCSNRQLVAAIHQGRSSAKLISSHDPVQANSRQWCVVLLANLHGHQFRSAPGIPQRTDDILGRQFPHDEC